jgi:hypothetical protein
MKNYFCVFNVIHTVVYILVLIFLYGKLEDKNTCRTILLEFSPLLIPQRHHCFLSINVFNYHILNINTCIRNLVANKQS